MWETVILQLVFSLPYADKLLFKGGTTLAKAGLIERFSEDIDLSLERFTFAITLFSLRRCRIYVRR